MTRHTVDPRDHQLRTAVAAELDWAPEVAADSIGVAVNRGTVILSGEVGTYLEKSAAVKAVLRVRGVTAVADEITVEHRFGLREDVDIARDAAQSLASDVALLNTDVKVTVEDGRVSLTGTVQWNYQRAAAVRSVSRIPGRQGRPQPAHAPADPPVRCWAGPATDHRCVDAQRPDGRHRHRRCGRRN